MFIQPRLAQEQGYKLVHKPNALQVVIGFPNTYFVGMSNLGVQLLYRELNNRPDAYCERLFLPDEPNPKAIASFETGRPLKSFDVIAFSVLYEMDYTNILKMLDLAGIPRRSCDRDERHPLVIGGGPAIGANPEPIADFFDLTLIGEGEDFIHEFAELYPRWQAEGLSRTAILREFAKQPCVYIPSLYRMLPDGTVEPIDEEVTPLFPWRKVSAFYEREFGSAILTPETEFSNRYLIQVSRGCAGGCRFCLAGYMYRPVRYAPVQRVIDSIESVLPMTNRIGLMGASVSDYPEIPALADYLAERKIDLSVASLRADNADERFIGMLARGGVRTLTFAPEAGSDRLRWKLNKKITNEEVLGAVEMAGSCGMRGVKMYSLIGVPEEEMTDIDALGDMMLGVVSTGRKIGMTQFALGCHPFVPKAQTPLQYAAMADEKTLDERLRAIEKRMRMNGVSFRTGSVSWALIQGVLSRGDRRISHVLELALDGGGNLGAWRKAFKELNLTMAEYLRERSPDEPLPWGHIESGPKAKTLAKQMDLYSQTQAPTAEEREHRLKRSDVIRGQRKSLI